MGRCLWRTGVPGVISSHPFTNSPPQTHMHLQSGLVHHLQQKVFAMPYLEASVVADKLVKEIMSFRCASIISL